jgi:hypothetical protein
MDALYLALLAPVIPVLVFAGAWVVTRPSTPMRGVSGLSCDGTRAGRI